MGFEQISVIGDIAVSFEQSCVVGNYALTSATGTRFNVCARGIKR